MATSTRSSAERARARHPVEAWICRELAALTHLPLWFGTFRKAGFTRRRAAFLAWRTTRPIPTHLRNRGTP